MKYLSIQTFQCGISVAGAATFTGGATINVLALNGATTSSEGSLFLGAHGPLEGGQLVLQKGTSQTYAAHLDNYNNQFRVLYGTDTASSGSALIVNLANRQLVLPSYTSSSSFSGTAAGYLAFDSSGNIITTAVPTSGVSSIIAGTGVTVSSGTGNVTVSIGQSVATSATPSFDQIFLTNNGNGTNVKIGDDAWIGDVNTANALRIMGQQNNADGYIIFGNSNFTALGRSGTGNLTYGGSTVWTAATLTNLNQLTNGPGYITSAALAGYVPTSRTLTINGTSYDLSADRTWTITTPYVSKLQHQVKAGVAINKGQAVYVTGADGTNMIVGLASNASEATSSKTMGLLDATVSTNGFANVVTEGLLAGLDTSTAGTEGDPVWLGTGGNLIYGLTNKPYAPAHLVFIGIVTRKNASNGEIFVKVQNGFELDELHDVDLKTTAPINGHLLGFNGTLWVNKTIAGWLGYTPANASGTTNYLSKFTGSTTLGNSLVYDNGTNVGIGTTSPSRKLHVVGDGLFTATGTKTTKIVGTDSSIEVEDGLSIFNKASNYGWLINSDSSNNFGIYNWNRNGYVFNIKDNAANGAFTISGSNVGIGATSPSKKLQIGISNATHADEGILLQSSGGYGEGAIYHDYGQSTGVTAFKILNTYSGSQIALSQDTYSSTGSPGSIRLYTAASGGSNTPVERMRITSDGNVGIGVTSPAYRLHVKSDTDVVQVIESTTDVTYTQYYNSSSGTGGSGNGLTIGLNGTSALVWYREVGDLLLGTNNTERVRILAGGNVGIGTSSPNEKLHVAGNIHAYAAGGIDAGLFASTSAGSTSIAIRSNGVTHFNGGNVGIGTNSPKAKLQVNNGHIAVYHNVSTDGAQIYLGDTNFDNSGYWNSAPGIGSVFSPGTTVAGDLAFYVYTGVSNSRTERMRIIDSGNVGIGTASPAYKLDVNGIGNFSNGFSSPSSETGYRLKFYDNGGTHNDAGIGLDGSGGGGEIMWFNALGGFYWGLGTGGTKMKLDSSGNLGIGTTSPSEKLEVAGAIKFGSNSSLPSAGISHYTNGYLYIKGGTSGAAIGNDDFSSAVYAVDNGSLEFYAGSSNKMHITSGGNVGIGTTSPGEKLHVSGASVGITIDGSTASRTYYNRAGAYIWSTGLRAGDTKFHIFDERSTDRLVIDDSGNVGIGTSSPTAKVAVDYTGYGISALTATASGAVTNWNLNSTILLSAASNSNGLGFGVSGTANDRKSWIQSGHPDNIYANYLGTLAINPLGGNVGIGTTSPSSALEIYQVAPIITIHSSDATQFHGIEFRNGNNLDTFIKQLPQTGEFKISNGRSVGWGGHITLYTDTVERMRITPSGNIGIGTTSPSTKLDVNGVITATGGNSTNWNTAYSWGNHSSAGYVPQARTLTINGTSYDLSANRSWTIATTTPGGSDTQFQYNSSGTLAGASALTYNSTTNRVGINQASPGYDLDVNGQVRVQDKLRVGTVNSGNGVVHMASTATINPSATTIVWSQNVSVGMCAFIEYYILNNNTTTDQRAGTIMVTWNQSGTPTIAHTETTTPDIGSTTPVIFTSSLVGSDARINAVNSSSAPYTIVMSYKYF
jgi:hypothetical protein